MFLDLGFPPHEAAVMLLRCELAEALRKWMAREGLTQAEAAARLRVVQPRISEIAQQGGQALARLPGGLVRESRRCSDIGSVIASLVVGRLEPELVQP